MLHLRLWILTFRKNLFARLFCILLIGASLPLLNIVTKVSGIESSDPYFHVLIQSSENFPSIVEKLKELPGINHVESISSQSLLTNLRKTVGEEAESLLNEIDFDYSGLKVSISSELRLKAQELLQTYIEKIAGEQVEVGPTFYPKSQIDKIQLSILGGDLSKVVVIVLLWLSFSFYFKKSEKSFLYLLKQFNRSQTTMINLYLFNFVLTFAIFAMVSIYFKSFGNYQYILMAGVLSLTLGFIPNLKKAQWQ